ncbi:unnamed protein product [Phytomonas sp. EM1]|nr:unnamed protein product [Phytomonas sp. EM1]|eukprot:CCW59750.1 unnamed protein product [Phytomonas sp. isolate EM1]
MTTIQIDDLDIEFPFEGYPSQVEYMRSVVKALQAGSNALLESPTGTGKTLCLLCASLAWLLRQKKPQTKFVSSMRNRIQPPQDLGLPKSLSRHKIVYCSRTHAQLAQVIRELKRTRYAREIRMALLGSREHMCVNSEVTRLPSAQAQQSMCNHLRGNKACRFFRGLQAKNFEAFLSEADAVCDLEDLAVEGKRSVFCPYYLERDESKDADIVFMPYNYILDPLLRKQLPFDAQGAVLIVDEAHNLPSVLSTAGCLNLPPTDLAHAIHECTRAVAMQRIVMEKEEGEVDVGAEAMREQEFAALKILLCQLETTLAAEPMGGGVGSTSHASPTRGGPSSPSSASSPLVEASEFVRPGAAIVEFLAKALITEETFRGKPGVAGVSDAISTAITLLSKSDKPASGLPRVQHFLETIFASDHGESTRFVIQPETREASSRRVLGYWKLDNAAELLDLSRRFHALLLTSGTLSPMEHFAAEMGIPFPVRLQGPHVIQPGQLWSGVLCRAPAGGVLNGSYAFRTSIDYRIGLGMTLVNLSRNAPGGTLVFFPSYTAMRTTVELWRTHVEGRFGASRTIWSLLEGLKPVFVEPTETSELVGVVSGFQKAVDEAPRKGAIFLAVCRGKISEGVDFADHHGRCVMVTGIPFANTTDLFVRLKREYLTEIAPRRPLVGGKPFTGDSWYRNEAMRAVNQCIGRVIRHKDDYGAVVLADERFAQQLENLSEWVSARTAVYREFRECYVEVSQFFTRYQRTTNGLARQAKPEIPFAVVSNPSVAATAACVPSSADHAKSFATEKELRTQEETQALQRRRLEEANEHPSRVRPPPEETDRNGSHLPSTRPPISSGIGGSPGCGPPALPKMERQKLVVVTDLCTEPPERKALTLGSTSKEFCTFLKERVSTSSYDGFKAALKEIAELRRVGADQGLVKENMRCVVDRLSAIFLEADAAGISVVVEVFSRHIPEELRALYCDLMHSKTKRT